MQAVYLMVIRNLFLWTFPRQEFCISWFAILRRHSTHLHRICIKKWKFPESMIRKELRMQNKNGGIGRVSMWRLDL